MATVVKDTGIIRSIFLSLVGYPCTLLKNAHCLQHSEVLPKIVKLCINNMSKMLIDPGNISL